METKNAIIKSTMLGIEDHGIMSFYLNLDYGGSGQSAGGYCLDNPIKKDGKFFKRIGTASGMSLIMEIMEVSGVSKWEDLPNTHIRVKADQGKVYAVGNILKDKWINFEQFFRDFINLTNETE
jgi:hypothetical protein